MIVLIKNKVKKNVSTGYSWKALMFGCLYPAFRGDWSAFFRHFLYYSLFGVGYLFTPFFYNRRYMKKCLKNGYEPFDDKARNYLESRSWYVSSEKPVDYVS